MHCRQIQYNYICKRLKTNPRWKRYKWKISSQGFCPSFLVHTPSGNYVVALMVLSPHWPSLFGDLVSLVNVLPPFESWWLLPIVILQNIHPARSHLWQLDHFRFRFAFLWVTFSFPICLPFYSPHLILQHFFLPIHIPLIQSIVEKQAQQKHMMHIGKWDLL